MTSVLAALMLSLSDSFLKQFQCQNLLQNIVHMGHKKMVLFSKSVAPQIYIY